MIHRVGAHLTEEGSALSLTADEHEVIVQSAMNILLRHPRRSGRDRRAPHLGSVSAFRRLFVQLFRKSNLPPHAAVRSLAIMASIAGSCLPNPGQALNDEQHGSTR